MKRDGARHGLDASRIVLMGHSAGAHLVALVGTDPRYLAAVGLTPKDLRGVIALDGAAYDVSTQRAAAGPRMRATYAQAFGDDPARQRALSPTLHAAAPNAPSFLLLHIQRPGGGTQANALAAALTKAGTPAVVDQMPGTGMQGHREINRALGRGDYPATAIVDAWLANVMAR